MDRFWNLTFAATKTMAREVKVLVTRAISIASGSMLSCIERVNYA